MCVCVCVCVCVKGLSLRVQVNVSLSLKQKVSMSWRVRDGTQTINCDLSSTRPHFILSLKPPIPKSHILTFCLAPLKLSSLLRPHRLFRGNSESILARGKIIYKGAQASNIYWKLCLFLLKQTVQYCRLVNHS